MILHCLRFVPYLDRSWWICKQRCFVLEIFKFFYIWGLLLLEWVEKGPRSSRMLWRRGRIVGTSLSFVIVLQINLDIQYLFKELYTKIKRYMYQILDCCLKHYSDSMTVSLYRHHFNEWIMCIS
jgi:hypothetical protein